MKLETGHINVVDGKPQNISQCSDLGRLVVESVVGKLI